jgi:hypothetical protein
MGTSSSQSGFPGSGRTLQVDFAAFRVKLAFASDTSLTYTVLNRDGSLGESETVEIKTERIAEDLFLVTWQEADKTTVVHIEDFGRQTIITNITEPGNQFSQFHGTFALLNGDSGMDKAFALDADLSYQKDIRPLFRQSDISCMSRHGVSLGDSQWMCIPSNAQRVYQKVAAGEMPPDGPWSADKVDVMKRWIDAGCKP